MEFSHVPVLLEECLEGLAIKPEGTYMDGTAGGAGHSKEIAKRLLKDVDVGATFFKGSGAYSGKEYEVLMVVMRAKLLPQARDVVKIVDDGAFMIVTNATSVFGQGFKEYDSEEV